MTRPTDNLPPIHPGIFLRDELEALNVSARTFADHIQMPNDVVAGIIDGQRSVTAQMAIRLGQAFGTTPRYWLNLQTVHDLKQARAEMPALDSEERSGSLFGRHPGSVTVADGWDLTQPATDEGDWEALSD
jgi:addiction module HigA family antidote